MNDIFDSSRKIEQQSEANKNERAKSQQDIGEFINETKKLVNAFGYGKPVDQDMIPVSYTHLDVYKRQLQNR